MHVEQYPSIKDAVEVALKEDREVVVECSDSDEQIRSALSSVPGDYRTFRTADGKAVLIMP
jgi:hypothetical protein